MTQTKKYKVGALIILMLGTILIWWILWQIEHKQYMTLGFLDIGQGDALYIETPDGTQVVVDGGPNAAILSELGKVMPFYDRSIDMLVVTNPDLDHYAGFIDVLERYRVGTVIVPGTQSGTDTFARFENSVRERGTHALLAKQGMRFMLDEEHTIYLDILFPDRDVSTWKSNDGSIVSRLVYDLVSVMLTGDATEKTERIVLGDYTKESLESDILKVGHHGSKTSSSISFLEAVDPDLAIISVGHNNKYGLPKQEILHRLENLNIPTLITYEEGTIVIQSDGKTFWRK
ncbi:MAG: MBL fold metallo-hydrolase [Candidatus Pacebacteria bacterium]|jgi:competence protein ComEC|nr:MBL fold metallo-hydrolase [Candidatus Paceibacterota bacterium]